ncbi:MAG: SGNH/GDSL hydrolase family protein, partial [Xanthobacteraceae bacterium]
QTMYRSLAKLAQYARENKIRIYLAMTPDVHNLKDYKFGFIHERMKKVASELGYEFVDLLPAFRGLTPEEVWAMPGDPHPNALGHRLMAETLAPVLKPHR